MFFMRKRSISSNTFAISGSTAEAGRSCVERPARRPHARGQENVTERRSRHHHVLEPSTRLVSTRYAPSPSMGGDPGGNGALVQRVTQPMRGRLTAGREKPWNTARQRERRRNRSCRSLPGRPDELKVTEMAGRFGVVAPDGPRMDRPFEDGGRREALVAGMNGSRDL